MLVSDHLIYIWIACHLFSKTRGIKYFSRYFYYVFGEKGQIDVKFMIKISPFLASAFEQGLSRPDLPGNRPPPRQIYPVMGGVGAGWEGLAD